MATVARARPAALNLTPAAEKRIADLMAKAPADAIGVKLSTPKRGCSGLSYSVAYVTEAKPSTRRSRRRAAPSGSMAARSST